MILFVLASCLTPDTFETRYAEEFCDYAQECEVLDLEGFSTLSECEIEVSILPDSCTDFSKKVAKSCLDSLSAMTCKDGMEGIPRTCNQVCP